VKHHKEKEIASFKWKGKRLIAAFDGPICCEALGPI